MLPQGVFNANTYLAILGIEPYFLLGYNNCCAYIHIFIILSTILFLLVCRKFYSVYITLKLLISSSILCFQFG